MRSLFVRIILLFLQVLLIATAIHLAEVMIARLFDARLRFCPPISAEPPKRSAFALAAPLFAYHDGKQPV
jgi:hypothetical protein